MKQTQLLILITLLILGYTQKQWQTEFIPWPYPLEQTTLGYCAQAYPAPKQKYCKTCLPGLIQYSDMWYFPCQLPTYVDYCISADWHLNCLLCTQGYYVKYNSSTYGFNQCISKRIGCQVYDEKNKNCKTCKAGFMMNMTLNFWKTPQNYCVFVTDPQCSKYNIDEITCEKCIDGYLLSGNKCVKSVGIANCESAQGNLCMKCISGYQLTSLGTCFSIPKIQNCEIQTQKVCQKCALNYQITLNGLCSFIPRISNCFTQVDYTCTQCLSGFKLQNNQCKNFIPNCLDIIDTKCVNCQSDFSLDQNGRCVARTIIYDPNCRKYDEMSVIGKCLQCSQGFFLKGSECLQIDPLCKNFDLKTGFCLSCYTGYKLNTFNGECQISVSDQSDLLNCNQYDYTKNVCVKCAEGSFFNSNGKCQKYSDIYCKIPSADFQSCSQCYHGYAYDTITKSCAPSKYNCLTFNPQGSCATCPNGFSLDANTLNCIQVDQFCKIFNPTTKKCIQCYQGYGLNKDLACEDINKLPVETKKYYLNCAKFDTSGSCSQCYFRWVLAKDDKGTFCQPVSDTCKTYSQTNGLCLTCYLGYYLINGKCQKYI